MVDTRTKGLRGEYAVRDLLRLWTGLEWERTPSSGALEHTKGDIYIPQEKQQFVIEVKNYKDTAIDHTILTALTNKLTIWWTKLTHQASTAKCKPILFFKHDRSKWFVAVDIKPKAIKKYLYMSPHGCYTMLAEEWLDKEWDNYVKESKART
tara:strand:- start:62414 stop:62869 length:456 start_codon:yes stop_codon:yes gene_type:complete